MAGSETHYRNSFIPQTTEHFLNILHLKEFLLYVFFFIHLKISLKVFTILKHASSMPTVVKLVKGQA